MNNYDYRKGDNYTETMPDDIAQKLVALADFGNDTETEETALNDIENALYYLDTLCQNEYNHDYFRTLYNVLARITVSNI